MLDVILKRFETPDEVRHFTRGRFELVHIGGLTIGRATYEPGWRWSVDVGPGVGAERCRVEHVGLVLAGRATARFDDGRVWELGPGTLFHIPPGATRQLGPRECAICVVAFSRGRALCQVRVSTMAKLLAIVGATVGGAIGWWLGAHVGTMTAFFVSVVGTGVGVYAGRRVAGAMLG